ncbi:MAG: PulJ/GspJ family protein [Minisyncoccia bacterium]|jgi:Tfp pilus assembly protein PilE
MGKFTYHKKAFTLIELLTYLGVVSIILILTFAIFYAIIFYSTAYADRVTLRTEMYKILQKFYYNSIIAKNASTSPNSIKFIFDNNFENYFVSSSAIFLENNSGISKFTSDQILVNNFSVATSGPFINVNISLKNLKGNYTINATSVIYLWNE